VLVATNDIVTLAAIDLVGARRTAIVRTDDVLVTQQGVVVLAPDHRGIAAAARDRIRAETAGCGFVDELVAATEIDDIVAFSAGERVVAVAATQRVIAVAAVNRIVPVLAGNRVIAVAA